MSSLSFRTHRCLIGTLAALAILAAGCGGGSKSSAPTTLLTVPIVTTTPPPGQPQLSQVVVQSSDLSTGWATHPASPSANQAEDSAAFAQCVGVPNTLTDVVAVAYSSDFTNGSSIVSSTATSFKKATDVQSDTAALSSAKASDCFVSVAKARLAGQLPKGATVKSVTLKITPGAGGGPTNVVARASGSVAFTASGHTLTLRTDVVFLIAPRIEAQVAFYSTGTAVSAQTIAAVVEKVSARLANGS